jgi:hypothetical protein
LNKSLAGSTSPLSTNHANIGISCGGAPQIHLLLAKEPAVHQGEKVFSLHFAFFHSFTGMGRGDEGGDDDDHPTSSISSLRLLFFNAPVFELLAEDAFILQVTGIFTHIRSRAAEGVDYGGSNNGIVRAVP